MSILLNLKRIINEAETDFDVVGYHKNQIEPNIKKFFDSVNKTTEEWLKEGEESPLTENLAKKFFKAIKEYKSFLETYKKLNLPDIVLNTVNKHIKILDRLNGSLEVSVENIDKDERKVFTVESFKEVLKPMWTLLFGVKASKDLIKILAKTNPLTSLVYDNLDLISKELSNKIKGE